MKNTKILISILCVITLLFTLGCSLEELSLENSETMEDGVTAKGGTPYIKVYTEKDYKGSVKTFYASYDITRHMLGPSHIKEIKSIKLFNGAKVTLFDGMIFRGSYRFISKNYKDLSTISFSKRTKSIRWLASTDPYYVLYDKPNYSGNKVLLTGPCVMLSNYKMDNITSSIKIKNGHRVWLKTDNNFGGKSQLITKSVKDLSVSKYKTFNNSVSSVKVDYWRYPHIIVYIDEQYGGHGYVITGNHIRGTNWGVKDFMFLNMGNKISSFKQPNANLGLQFFKGSNFTGDSWSVDSDDGDYPLIDYSFHHNWHFDNAINSMRSMSH